MKQQIGHVCTKCGLQFYSEFMTPNCAQCGALCVAVCVVGSASEFEVHSVDVDGKRVFTGYEWPEEIEEV